MLQSISIIKELQPIPTEWLKKNAMELPYKANSKCLTMNREEDCGARFG